MMESPWGRSLDLSYWDDQGSIPLCILQLDPADRAVLRIAGKSQTDRSMAVLLFVTYDVVSTGLDLESTGTACVEFSSVLTQFLFQ